MTDTHQQALSARADQAQALTAALGLAPQAWGVVAMTIPKAVTSAPIPTEAGTLPVTVSVTDVEPFATPVTTPF